MNGELPDGMSDLLCHSIALIVISFAIAVRLLLEKSETSCVVLPVGIPYSMGGLKRETACCPSFWIAMKFREGG